MVATVLLALISLFFMIGSQAGIIDHVLIQFKKRAAGQEGGKEEDGELFRSMLNAEDFILSGGMARDNLASKPQIIYRDAFTGDGTCEWSLVEGARVTF